MLYLTSKLRLSEVKRMCVCVYNLKKLFVMKMEHTHTHIT